jgi:predicted GH43/DUF377 family glycosyl hydrolase
VRRILALLVPLAVLVMAAPAHACSRDDTTYLDAFLDAGCLEQPLTSTTLDAFGGLRLTTNGTPETRSWDSETDFGATLGQSTLAVDGTGAAARLLLSETAFPLAHDAASPVLGPPAATAPDSENVDDPAVVKVGPQWVMYYTGTPEDGGAPRILRATSPDGKVWTRTGPVLAGTPGTWDEHGVHGAEVLYDPTDASSPFRMWYSGRGDVFGAIGHATSPDGITWTKHPAPVLDHGQPGSADSFAAADPSVLKDGDTWKMWYTGDDSSKKRIAYATSQDGVAWTKGGKVISPEDDGVSANVEFGAFAPTVWKDGNQFRMLLAGRKLVGGDVFQTKLMDTRSANGVDWDGPSPALNPSGTDSKFDFSNLDSPEVVADGSALKLFYSGNTVDANGNFHTRIGLAESPSGGSFGKFNGAQTGGSVLDVAPGGTRFDSRQASGLSVIAPAGGLADPKYLGAYWGTRGSDFEPRIGLATSGDGSAWTKVDGPEVGASTLEPGTGQAFDVDGQRDPWLLEDGGDTRMYFTGLKGGVHSIGYATGAGTPLVFSDPANAAAFAGDGSGFDSAGVAHPSVVKDGSSFVAFYTGIDGSGNTAIGRAVSASADLSAAVRGAGAVLSPTTGTFDAAAVKDPVVVLAGPNDWRMLYTGVEVVEGTRIERVGYATSSDGQTWSKQGLLLNPSQAPHAYDERGVQPTGVVATGADVQVFTSGIDETGRTRGGHWLPAAAGVDRLATGWATYQFGGPDSSVRDFRSLARTQTGDVDVWVSFLQPYSSAGKEFWSAYLPLEVNPATLNFLLTVRAVRWQARLSDPASSPALDRLDIVHAPVSFSAAGSATTTPITPPAGKQVTRWTSIATEWETFSPAGATGGSAGTVHVLDGASGAEVASGALGATVDLAGLSVAEHPTLKVRLDLTSDGQSTPLVTLLKLVYNQEPVPPPPPVLTLTAAPAVVVFGAPVTLAGTLTGPAGPLGGAAVKLFDAAAALPDAVTDPAGAYSATAIPQANTVYRASFPGGAADVTAAVQVKQAVTLKVVRKGTKGTFTGTVGPAHPNLPVVIQRRSGTTWSTFATFRTGATSAFTGTKKLKRRTKYRFRAVTSADADHLGGESTEVLVERQRVTLKVSASGRKATFTGVVKPRQRTGTVVIQALKAGKWVKLGKAKLTRRSTFKLVKKMARGSHKVRARRAANRFYFGGTSATKTLRVR